MNTLGLLKRRQDDREVRKVAHARLKTPEAVAYDAPGNRCLADSNHHRLRKVDSSDTIQTMVGTGRAENTGDFGPASAASIFYPSGIAFSHDGIAYVSTAHCIRALLVRHNGVRLTVGRRCAAFGQLAASSMAVGIAKRNSFRWIVEPPPGALT